MGASPQFPPTLWSLVVSAGSGLLEQSVPALEKLCSAYWYPVYAYIRRKGHDADEARDLTQEFFTRLLEKDYLSSADRSRGRFRSFLLLAVQRFLFNAYDRQRTQRRGGGAVFQPLETEAAEGRYRREPAHEITPEAIYERRWALMVLERALDRVKSEAATPYIDRLMPFLIGEAQRGSYETVAAELGMSEGALRVAVHRLRDRFRQSLRGEIRDTLSSDEEIEGEVQHLMKILARPESAL